LPLPDLAIASRRIQLDAGEFDGALLIRDATIQAVVGRADVPPGLRVDDFGSLVVMAGRVDTHVHVNEPGRTDWEGFENATRAAAAGGTTTVVDMPLNSVPVTTTLEALERKREAARGRCFVDCGFWGGVVPGNAAQLEPMIEAGVCGFKAFLIDSGIEEFPAVAEPDLRAALPILAKHGVPLLVHAELALDVARTASSPRRYSTYLSSRPDAWERDAIELIVRLCREYRGPVHVVHLSSATALTLLRAARAEGLPITAETCPHYLVFDAESVADGATEFKCAPPIRERSNRERLWAALADGTIDLVVSDHSPCTPELKARAAGDFTSALGGIASLQLALSATWTEARARGLSPTHVARWMCEAPARQAGLDRKGRLAVGCDADVVVWDPDAAFSVTEADLHHRHKLTPYLGRRLQGLVRATYLRGRKVYDRGSFTEPIRGELLTPHGHQ
jgi:allantoinase